MAKSFSENEKTAIRKRMFEAGMCRFIRQGIRAVRIDDLCRDAGIAKGSFYAFYPSKEALFMAISQHRETRHRQDVREFLLRNNGTFVAQAADFFDLMLEKTKSDPLLNVILEHGELEYLIRKIPPEQIADGAKSDHEFSDELLVLWRKNCPKSTIQTSDFIGLMTLMVALLTRAPMIPATQMTSAVNVLRTAFITQMTAQTPQPISAKIATSKPGKPD